MTAKKWRSPAMLLALALLLALSSLGVGYGLWSKTLTIEGTVETGEVDAEWIYCYCRDEGFDPNPDGTNKGKDVGSTTCEFDSVDPQILHITVNDGYPSYWNYCSVEFQNAGTIPVIIRGTRVTGVDFTLATSYGANDGEIWVQFVDGIGTQMDLCPADSCTQQSSLKFHVEQMALENHDYHFTVEVCLAQWNEDATAADCFAAAAP